MRSRFVVMAVVCAVLLAGCTGHGASPEEMVSQNNFESLDGWLPVPPALTLERAHSGRYATKVDAGIEYGQGYRTSLTTAGLAAGQQLVVSAWALRTAEQANATLVVQLIDPSTGRQVGWQGLDIAEQIKTYNRWMFIDMHFQVPADAQPQYELRVYPWRGKAAQPVYFDDIQIRRTH